MKKEHSISKFLAKRGVRATLVFLLVSGVSGVVTYYAFPALTKKNQTEEYVDIGDDYPVLEMSSVDKFASKLTTTTGIEGTLDLSLFFPDKDGDEKTMNTIKIDDALLKVAIPNMNNIGFDFQGSINYNDWGEENTKKATAHINLVDKNAYIDFWGAKLAYLDTEYKSLVGELIGIFSESVVKVPDGVYDFIDQIGELTGNGAASESGASSAGTGIGVSSSLADTSMDWSLVDEGETINEYQCTIGLSGTEITLHLFSDKDYNLTRVYANDVTFEDFTFSVDFNTTINSNELQVVRGLVPTDAANYTSLLGLKGILRKVGNAIAKERFNVDLDLNINHSKGDVNENIGVSLDGSMNFDAKDYVVDLSLFNADEKESVYSQNLSLAYLTEKEDSIAYVNYNDVTKASMNLITLEALMSRMKGDAGNNMDLSALAKIFDFVFDSPFVKAVQKGRYELIADEVDKIEISSEKIVLKVKLDKIGLGKDSLVTITFDGTTGTPISNIEVFGVSAKGFALDGSIKIKNFAKMDIDTAGFYQMDHLPDVYDQIADLIDSKQATLSLEGTVLDENHHGLSLNGGATIDGKNKAGSGSLNLSQINANYTKNHVFTLDLNEQAAFFNYNDFDRREEYDGLNGTISIASVNDLINTIKDLTGNNQVKDRFGGLFASLAQDSASGIINDVLDGKYAPLMSAKVLNKCQFSTNNVDLVINGEIFGLESDVDIIVAFSDKVTPVTAEDGSVTDEVVRNIHSISLKDFVINGQTINLTISLDPYDGKLERLDKSLTYTDFSSVTLLTKYLMNTATKLDTYHLESRISVLLWTADIIDIDASLFVSVGENDELKIYGELSNIPLIPAINNDTWLFGDHGEGASYYRSVNFYYDGDNIYVHGLNPFGVFEAEDEEGVINSYDFTETQDYKYAPSYFQTTDNILHFLLKDVINLQDRLLSKVDTNGIALPENTKALATEKLFQSFQYDPDDLAWDISLDLGGLLNNDFLKTLDLHLAGTFDEYLSDVSLALTIFAGVKIQITADFSLKSIGSDSFPTSDFETYLNAHSSDPLTAE